MTIAAPPPNIGKRLFRIGIIAAGLALLMFFVHLIVWDRQDTARQVEADIARSWGGPQRITTPVVVIPYRRETVRTVRGANGETREEAYSVTRYLHLAAETVEVETVMDPEVKRRTLYEVPVYTAATAMTLRFPKSAPADGGVRADRLRWGEARIILPLDNPRNLVGLPNISVDGRSTSPTIGVPGTETDAPMISASLGLTDTPSTTISVAVDMTVKGSRDIVIASAARKSKVTLSSSWPDPGFAFHSPTTQTVGPDGFKASWVSSNLADGTRSVWRGHPRVNAAEIASVSLVEPVDLYAKLGRGIKYGVLFIALTFTAYIMFDMIGGRAMPMIGYGLVGLGLVQFFVLLTSLSEHIGFVPAYILAASILTLMISAYTASVVENRRRAGLIGTIITALYAGLYSLLGLEESALLIGSLMLLAALAGLMYATRNIGQEPTEGA
ncbi:MAG: cell envelope integrity protein CreD [Pacificimonas sp.]